ncbi:hypothetical protein J4475_03985 [Candidatus Woesearchaeota archaeon]|nr:hypothetical protein [Candidatus Woesearchaeota archaeon]
MGKRGYFFTLDAFIAIGVIMTGVFIVLLLVSSRPFTAQSVLLAQDLANSLVSTKVKDINNPVFSNLTNTGIITNAGLSPLTLFGEFYFRGLSDQKYNSYNSLMVYNLTEGIFPREFNFEIRINNASIYRFNTTALEDAELIVSSKRIISGSIDNTQFWGPYPAEVLVWQ